MSEMLLERERRYVEELEQFNVLDGLRFQYLEATHLPEYEALSITALARANEVARINAENYFGEENVGPTHSVDAIGYHRRYVELEESGADEEALIKAEEARKYNVRSGFNEAMQAMTWDLSPERFYEYNEEGKLTDGGFVIEDMLYDGALSGTTPPIELQRRKHEAVNFSVIQEVGYEDDALDVAFVEFSLRNTECGVDGYVEPIDKMQLRYSRFVDTDEGRKLSVRPIYINGLIDDDEMINDFLNTQGLDRTQLLGNMTVVDSKKYASVVDVVEALDTFASVKLEKDIFLGEEGTGDYAELPKIMEARNEMTKEAVEVIDSVAMELAREKADPMDVAYEIKKVHKKLAMEICRDNVGLGAVVFDMETERLLEQVRAEQDSVKAGGMMGGIIEQASDLQGCVSCGLAMANSMDRQMAIRAGLKEFGSGGFLVDKSANVKCPNPSCGTTGSFIWGENSAMCTACGSVRKGNKVETKNDDSKEHDEKRGIGRFFISFDYEKKVSNN